MSDVSTYALESKLQSLEYRVKSLEQTRDYDMERQTRRNELMLHLMVFIPVLVTAVILAVSFTLEAAGH